MNRRDARGKLVGWLRDHNAAWVDVKHAREAMGMTAPMRELFDMVIYTDRRNFLVKLARPTPKAQASMRAWQQRFGDSFEAVFAVWNAASESLSWLSLHGSPTAPLAGLPSLSLSTQPKEHVMTTPKPTHTIQADGIRLSLFQLKPCTANDAAIMIERDQGRSGQAWYPTATIHGNDLHALGKAVHEMLLYLSTPNGSSKPIIPPTPRTVQPAAPTAAPPSPTPQPSSIATKPAAPAQSESAPQPSTVPPTPYAASGQPSTPSTSRAPTPLPPVTAPSAKVSIPQATGSTSTASRDASPKAKDKPRTPANAKTVRRAASVAGKHGGRSR